MRRIFIFIIASILLSHQFALFSQDYMYTLKLKSITASATLMEKGKSTKYYSAEKAFDGDLKTAWCAPAGKSIGAALDATVSGELIKHVLIMNGYGRNQSLYDSNNRVKGYKLEVTYTDGKKNVKEGELDDSVCAWDQTGKKPSPETPCLMALYAMRGGDTVIEIPRGNVKHLIFTILSVYPGLNSQDTCIAEIQATDGLYK